MTDRMLPKDRLDVDVEVLIGDTWRPGTLEHWRQRDGRWEGFVRWSTEPGSTHIGWFDEEQLRRSG